MERRADEAGRGVGRWPWPLRGWIGLVLVAVFWSLNWGLSGLRTHWGFFPLWLGYCLVIDALVYRRRGTSLLTRGRWRYVALFVLSAPSWWLFEVLNWRVQNWEYLGREHFDSLSYFLFATLSFSTVIPAVFGTAELASTFRWIERLPPCKMSPRAVPITNLHCFIAGWTMLGLLLAWPRYFFPFLWVSLFLILEPVNAWLGFRTIGAWTRRGEVRPLVALAVGVLICGFFWEMWNFHSYPKWIYHVPFVGFLHIFEMPLLGYGGYVPFALELLALYHIAAGLSRDSGAQGYVSIGESRGDPA